MAKPVGNNTVPFAVIAVITAWLAAKPEINSVPANSPATRPVLLPAPDVPRITADVTGAAATDAKLLRTLLQARIICG